MRLTMRFSSAMIASFLGTSPGRTIVVISRPVSPS